MLSKTRVTLWHHYTTNESHKSLCDGRILKLTYGLSLTCTRTHTLISLQWRHNERDGVSNHQPHDCLLNRIFKAQNKENIKAPRLWPLSGEFIEDRWIPRTKGQSRGKCFHLMTSSCHFQASPWMERNEATAARAHLHHRLHSTKARRALPG